MKHFVSPRGLRAAIVAVFGVTLISATPQPSIVARSYAATETTVDVGITPRDVAASNQKVRMAHSALVSMWDNGFRKLGQRFYAPGIIPFYRGVRTGCKQFASAASRRPRAA